MVRRARPEEAETLSRLALASKARWPYPAEQLAEWRDQLAVSPAEIDANLTCVAECDGEVVGFYLLCAAQGPWSLEHFWVAPAHMGKGVGRCMLASAARLAAQAGARSLIIAADPFAEGFYLTCGAVRMGALPAPIASQPARQLPQLRLDLQEHP